jgi:carboxylesterase type B
MAGCAARRRMASSRSVSENIERFGGDPRNVMIFGESGGGAKTSCLYALPSAAPYFNKASIESGPGIRVYPVESAIATTGPAYTTEQRATMFIEAECRVVNDPFSLERQVWETV